MSEGGRVPVYQYVCNDCGEPLEVRQSFTDDSLTVCPACAGRLRKVLSAVGVVFKGSGFYRTDSRKDASKGSKEPAAAGASSKDGGTSTGSSETGSASTASSNGSASGSGGSAAKSSRSAASAAS